MSQDDFGCTSSNPIRTLVGNLLMNERNNERTILKNLDTSNQFRKLDDTSEELEEMKEEFFGVKEVNIIKVSNNIKYLLSKVLLKANKSRKTKLIVNQQSDASYSITFAPVVGKFKKFKLKCSFQIDVYIPKNNVQFKYSHKRSIRYLIDTQDSKKFNTEQHDQLSLMAIKAYADWLKSIFESGGFGMKLRSVKFTQIERMKDKTKKQKKKGEKKEKRKNKAKRTEEMNKKDEDKKDTIKCENKEIERPIYIVKSKL
ncbi:uncharacterized protein OCT59_010231 [Rhizophagus irregularis]|uniref:Uncharacterized protein n=2 Tax=Rhizophagus irregularis TaxID=588596 RepID=A0A915ZPD7_9GLOM|nr:hypothetical protein GLOIN_2v439536 [Rhizophagus irregularis DAOM 181602=DAOM 197198]UZO18924.1 hypothetical protein OCT59_010231 [Rhizophagus irregularis]POG65085.1 hypothetical protein GLOIN_2v439536 [Rhizophagus irregularis DAOM 181602=DAOM 197198]CAB4460893.1 unnamed protein product [Rhizophagus irregularis]CAB5382036.1 unnamed protein product [Rhizophagus irregularis]GBC38638.1 hypothetical protein GLOIN_2v439536 [Rhizophagus irregularis DAOM 181602=DAOM 197198]|eukprot:XP_025171951.1 hypothetical protein GLOIN_2v439536 [Rhizophagus irregularis DAOM 181602=DAOM 197198]